nr:MULTISPECIES: aldo/keto reductase [unclassified Pseudomonas]
MSLVCKRGSQVADDQIKHAHNEAGVGRSVAENELIWERIFITTKIGNTHLGFDRSPIRAFEVKMQRLELEPLVFIGPSREGAYRETWKAFVRSKKEGRVRFIGVSNFDVEHLTNIMDDTGVVPSLNQIEFHPGFNQANLSKWCHQQGIITAS